MISKLKGIVDSTGLDWAVIDVGGVGYHVVCSSRTLQALPRIGEAATLFVDTFIREDHIRLYGFASDAEREWFRLLQTVQGVGSRVALAVLSTLSVAELQSAISLQDKAMVSRAPGVGAKVAARIVAELKDKAAGLAVADPALARLSGELGGGGKPSAGSDAVSALVNLGYGQSQAGTAVATAIAEAGDDATTERLIRLALKELAR
ncbi:Holliday junction branch migration protein RuvA [Lutibaculum baratangense]|uniref:Holliday junction branch migration complex subunit RuvA n=1 Tax=Lutibaculum baratangense AMV1 TaxID=631454 RepID=V4RSR8_9HYPH|nr:Holliday junction branch migration protein RuvA [Lutibaculum baratangense]ESR26180.1 Holliday junction DNA helicase RuvA [Lutibaculum baratangense AMV1]